MSRDPLKGFLSLSGPSAFEFPLHLYAGCPQSVIDCPISRSEQFTEAFEQLRVFRGLDENWDGYGGSQVGEMTIANVRSLLTSQLYSRATLGVPDITPTSNGTLVIEWQGRDGEAAFEVGNTRISGIVKPNNSQTVCMSGDTAVMLDYLPTFIAPFLNPQPSKAAAITPVEYAFASNG